MTSLYYSEIGQILKIAREDLRISLQQASYELHIRAHYLHALEEGKFDNLPGAAYTRGYLQSYAVFLRLDKDEILRRFELLESELPKKGLFLPQSFSSEKKPAKHIIWGSLFFALAAYLVWFFAFRPDFKEVSMILPPPDINYMIKKTKPSSILHQPCFLSDVAAYPPCYFGNYYLNVASEDITYEDINYYFYKKINSVLELGIT